MVTPDSPRAAAARNWARKGYWLTPVRLTPEGKVYLRGEKDNGVKWGASNDPDEVSAWWTPGSRYADAHIGVVTELSGVVCVDLDRGHADGVDGVQEWAALGQEPYPYPAYVDHTPRGGQHLLYRADPARPVKGSAGAVAPGVDTKGIGSMFILYTDALPVMEPSKLPPVPSVVAERAPHSAAPSTAPSTTSGEDPFAGPPRCFTREEARAFCAEVLGDLERAAPGTVNHRLNTAAKTIYHFVPEVLERSACDSLLLDLTRKACVATGTVNDPHKDRATLESAWSASRRDWLAEQHPDPFAAPPGDDPGGARSERVIDLTPYLDGSYVPPTPSVGLERDDGKHLLYPGRWHTVMALTAAGKSWLALWHALEEIRRGNRVVYGHFEEGQPSGTISRLLQLGATAEEIGKLFTWVDCTKTWAAGEFGATMAGLETAPVLVILDGINAACSQHGWPVNDPIAVGSYRSMFVTPAAATGAAVLSLGHPPKARDRQGERHGFGSTAWLDEVDGVGFRMRASKEPIGRGRTGNSALFTVKDRYGQVEALGRPDGDEDGWYYVGSFHIDDSPERRNTVARLSAPKTGDEGKPLDSVDLLALAIVGHLERTGLGTFASVRSLSDAMRARKIKFTASDLPVALELLASRDVIDWPEVSGDRKPRPGSLIVEAADRDS